MKLTILMPCLNEEDALPFAIEDAKELIRILGVCGEVLIVDNGSTDRSREIAESFEGVRVVACNESGYGNALRYGIERARGIYLILGDCDGTYRFSDAAMYYRLLEYGYDAVFGDRFSGEHIKGAWKLSHKLGVSVLSAIARYRYKCDIKDFHCGLMG